MWALFVLTLVVGLALLAARWYSPGDGTFGAVAGGLHAWPLREAPAPFGVYGAPGSLLRQSGSSGLELVLVSARNSALLAGLALAVAASLGIPAGFWMAMHAPARLIVLLRTTTGLGLALPSFFIAFLLQLAAIAMAERTGATVIPVYGYGLDSHLVIPVVALALGPLAYISRLVLIGAADRSGRDFVRSARAKGLAESAVIYRHVLPNMLGTIGEALLGASCLTLSGLAVVEYLVLWPGLGILALRAANAQEVGLLIGAVMPIAILLLIAVSGLDELARRTNSADR